MVCPRDEGDDRRGTRIARGARGRAGRPARGRAHRRGEPALGAAIVYVCAHMRWPVGHAYLADEGSGALAATGVWYLEDEARYAAFREATEQRGASGLPRQVIEAGEPAWVADVATEPGFARADAAVAAGLRSGFAFPVLMGTQTV